MSEVLDRQLFDVKAAAEYLVRLGASGASVSFVRSLIASGKVPHLKIGKKFFVYRSSVDAWLQRSERRVRP
jgi:excisionase family DNA binding protein